MQLYSGCKNTFLITLDNGNFSDYDRIPTTCKDVDGLLLVQKSDKADTKMAYYNKNGSRASMCGNGLRCVAHFAQKTLFPNKKTLLIETDLGLRHATIQENIVEVEMGPVPKITSISLDQDGCKIYVSTIDTGVPHAVLKSTNLNSIDVISYGRKIRYHPTFLPEGTNVTFATLLQGEEADIATRTYERGVEGETLACGTGAVAAAIVCWNAFPAKNTLTLRTRSGEMLFVRRDHKTLFLKGMVACV